MTRFFIMQCYYSITKDLGLQYSSNSHIYCVLPMCQGYIWDFIISNYKHSLLVTKWGLHVITLHNHFIGYNNAYIGFRASLFCNVLMYYLITRDLELQHAFDNCIYCVMSDLCIKVVFDIYSFNDAKIHY